METHFLGYQSSLNDLQTEAERIDAKTGREQVAKKYNFASWQQAVAFVAGPDIDPPNFEHLCCLTYWYWDGSDRWQRAVDLAKNDPERVPSNIYTYCCLSDVDGVRRIIDADPTQASTRGGYFDWEPLLYACYSRYPEPVGSTTEVVELLLDAGADPNAAYRWGGQYWFTALTGAVGNGEQGLLRFPRHPEGEAIARLLLERGADANDGQALYNWMLGGDPWCLKLLLEYGLNAETKQNWLDVDDRGSFKSSDLNMFEYLLRYAVDQAHSEMAGILLDHGADGNIESEPGLSLYKQAMLLGEIALAERISEQMPKTDRLNQTELLKSAVLAEDRNRVDQLLKNDKSLFKKLTKLDPDMLVVAVTRDKREAVNILLDIGWDVNLGTRSLAIHHACFAGDLPLVKQLVDAGSDLEFVDKDHGSTPIGWARHAEQRHIVEFLNQ